MGVEYQRWLIPRGNVFAPGGDAVAKLVEELRVAKWIAGGGHAVKTIENVFGTDAAKRRAAQAEPLPSELTRAWLDHPSREEVRLVWPIESAAAAAVRYPLSHEPGGELAWSLEVHRSPEYVYPIAETIDPIPTECACGEDLAFDWDEDEVVCAFTASSGIFAECEECSRTFDPSKGRADITNPFDDTTEEVLGGAAYRFAIKVDCGKSFVADAKLAFSPELVELVEKTFGRAFYEVGALS